MANQSEREVLFAMVDPMAAMLEVKKRTLK
jgi:hypothetical protein